ncbi:MAG: hypothetical protein AAFV29_17855, partial [Myxococcota bacterium]
RGPNGAPRPINARDADDFERLHERRQRPFVVVSTTAARPQIAGRRVFIYPEIDVLKGALPDDLDAVVYGSTTGAFGQHEGSPWIDEDTPSRDLGARGRRRYDYERALATFVKPLKVVRIAGIYGPRRTIWAAMKRPNFLLFEGGPPTSRIHVDDLATLLMAMGAPKAPSLAIACDEAPTPTLQVAQFTCALMRAPAPEALTLDAAKAQLSASALEMRMGGRRCRSKIRPGLIGELKYPTYKTGIPAALLAEGILKEV